MLVRKTMEMLRTAGYEPENVDATVVAEQPKLRPYIQHMQQTLADVMQIDPDDISIKATTTEHLGFTGRNEGIAAYASVLISDR
jgi:2-C-methyl-D-erythritol 2,4-cyclodiphosphate synthase